MLMAIIWWIVVGLIAGAIAGFLMKGSGFGIVGDIVVGIIGAIIGGFVAGLFGLGSGGNLVLSIVIAVIGACIFIALLRLFSRGTARRTL
jgi:uncharacterized membrane protein YeaQ/YmgE (transglycosylase-associated protein family)